MPDGEVFSMRKGAERFFADDIVRVTPAPKLCGWVGGWLRCLSSRRGQSVLTDLEPAAGTLERRRDRLARMHRMWFHPSGYTLGYTKRGALGTPTELVCLELDGRVHRVLQLPDAISEVVEHWGDWLVGCRNGHLYAYSVDGNMVWDRMPARNEVQEYAHPFALPTAPYFLARLVVLPRDRTLGSAPSVAAGPVWAPAVGGGAIPSARCGSPRVLVFAAPTKRRQHPPQYG